MTNEQNKLVELLSMLDDGIIQKLVDMAYAMRVKHPRPRATMNRFVLCDKPVVSAVTELLCNSTNPVISVPDTQELQVRLAIPKTREPEALAEQSKLEVYGEEGAYLHPLPLLQLNDDVAREVRAELWREACYYANNLHLAPPSIKMSST